MVSGGCYLALLAVEVELVLTDCHRPDVLRQLWRGGEPSVHVDVTRSERSTTDRHSETRRH